MKAAGDEGLSAGGAQARRVGPEDLLEAEIHRTADPGGNHGSLFRASTHSTLLLAGGERTGVPRGLVVEEPYDSLSFMPTLLALTGQIESGTRPVPVLWQRGFRPFPGRVIRELFDAPREQGSPVAGSARAEDAP